MSATAPKQALKPAALAGALRMDILDGRLAPGTRLVERALIERFGVARHSLRAALRTLEAEGLVTIVPHRGATVRTLDPAAFTAMLELRAALELEAARLALARDPERLAAGLAAASSRLSAACTRSHPAWHTIVDAHAEVHAQIVEAAHSPRIAAAHAALAAEMRLFVVALAPTWSLERMAAHHEALAGDLPREGPAALRRHLEDGMSSVTGGTGTAGLG